MIEERRILRGNGAINLKALIRPAADPIAVVKICMARIAVAHERFVMAAAGTERPCPAFMAVVLGIDISSAQKIVLLLFVDARGHIAQDMLVRVDKAMAGCDVA